MFEHVVLRRAEGGAAISAGMIAEALLFYQRVHVFLDRGTLAQLLGQIGVSQLIALSQRADFSGVYTEEILATMTSPVGPLQVHDFGAMTLSGDQTVGNLKSTPERFQYDLERAGIAKSEAKNFAKAFLQKVPVRRLSGDHFLKGGIPDAARADLQDSAYVLAAIRTVLPLMPGGYDPGEGLKFQVIRTELGNYVFHNIDLPTINARRAAMTPQQEPLTIAHLLAQIQDARADLALAAHYGGDFVTSAVTSAVVQLRHAVLLQRTHSNIEAQRTFAEIALPDMPTVAEVIDSGEQTFSDFLKLLDRSARFKHWVKSANPDEGLAREYMRAVSSQDWIQTNRVKGVRYVMTLAADALNPLAGLAAGFADNFLVEKLLGGWRPNHFVENRLSPFLSGR